MTKRFSVRTIILAGGLLVQLNALCFHSRGAVTTTANMASNTITTGQLASGVAAANLNAAGQSGVAVRNGIPKP